MHECYHANTILCFNAVCILICSFVTDLDRCGEIDAVELCQHIFPVFAPAYAIVTNADGSISGAHVSADNSSALTSAFAASAETASAATKATSATAATASAATAATDTMEQLAAVACEVSDSAWNAAPDAVMIHDESKQELDTTAYEHHLH
jgi:hypothetical protein